MGTEKTMLPEQQAAIDSIKNTVVAAGAGSGKTTVLSLRFLNLIQKHHFNVDEILTLTFTKKATVEMSSRIYNVLKNSEPEQAANFYKANIKTLDSYCNSVAKLGCRFYGISPDFVQDKDLVETQVKSKALPFLLEHRNNPSLKKFLKVQDYEKVADELFIQPILEHSKIAEPIDFRGDFERQCAVVQAEWKRTSERIQHDFNGICRYDSEFTGKKTSKTYAEFLRAAQIAEEISSVEMSLDQIKNGEFERIKSYVESLSELNFPKLRGKDDDSSLAIDYIEEYKRLQPKIIELGNFVYGVPFLNELFPLLEEFQQIVMDVKRSLNCLTFADVSNMALCILRDHPEIRALEKEKYKAIMIDEFQDNNKDQRDMLFLLAEKKDRMEKGVPSVQELELEKLFFVGDEKQSIYRFRGADVEVFNNLSKDFENGKLNMVTNHRSHPTLIAAFNAIFGGEFYKSEGKKLLTTEVPPSVFYNENLHSTGIVFPTFEAVYHKVLADERKIAEAKERGDDAGHKIHLAFYEKETEAPKGALVETNAEAEWVARKILEKHADGYDFSDMAILFKTYAAQAKFERTLLRHGIPYHAETFKGIFSDGPVNDIAAYFKLCIYPDDEMAYAKVLSSPFVNLSVAETQAILSLHLEPFADVEEKSCVKDILEGESLERFNIAGKFYKKFKEELKENSLCKSVSILWYEAGYRYETMWNMSVKMYEKMYDLLFEFARQADDNNLNPASFVDSLYEFKDENQKVEVNVPVEKSEGVNIMTVHKSKGLEFKIVFICDIQRGSIKEFGTVPAFYNDKYGITINTPKYIDKLKTTTLYNYFFDITKEENYSKETAEMRRLTYVALTRAEDEIFITSGSYKEEKKPEEFKPGGSKKCDSILKTLQPIIAFYNQKNDAGELLNNEISPFTKIEKIPPYSQAEVNSENARPNTSKFKKEFVKELESLKPYENVKILKRDEVKKPYISPSKLYEQQENISEDSKNIQESTKDEYKELEEIFNERKDFKNNDFGTIAHSYMEAAVKGIKDQIPYKNKDIVGLENSKLQIKKVEQICEKMRDKFLESDFGKKVQNSTWKKAEYEFKSRVCGHLISGTIDLVFKTDDGKYAIVDYKTNRKIEPEIYFNQLACYKKAVSQMLGVDKTKVDCYLWYLRYGTLKDITADCEKVDIEKVISELEI